MRFKRKHFEIAVYLARPAILSAWWQKSAYYKRGFVVRLLWLGFVLRFQGRDATEAKTLIQRRHLAKVMRLIDSLPDTDGYEPDLEDYESLLNDPEFYH